jgi:hypothetical protein
MYTAAIPNRPEPLASRLLARITLTVWMIDAGHARPERRVNSFPKFKICLDQSKDTLQLLLIDAALLDVRRLQHRRERTGCY